MDALSDNYNATAQRVQGLVSAAITAGMAAGDELCVKGIPELVAAAQEEAVRGLGIPDAQANAEAATAALVALAGQGRAGQGMEAELKQLELKQQQHRQMSKQLLTLQQHTREHAWKQQ